MTVGEDGLERRLSVVDATAIVVGAVVGSAIFLIPSSVFAAHPAPAAAMIVFATAGILSFFGALAYGELSSMFPATGGEYIYLQKAWGSPTAFLCGWSYFVVVQTGGIAALAVGFANLAASITPLDAIMQRVLSVALLVTLTVLNYRGVKTGAWTGNVLTACKLAGLFAMIAAAAVWPSPRAIDWSWPREWHAREFGIAIVPVLWAYEGWNIVTFVGGEIRNPRGNIPKALAFGLAIVFAVYSASLWVYLRVLSVPEIVASPAVAPAAATRILGGTGGILVTMTMVAALVGSTNACILAASRVYFAQARQGLFFRSLAAVHPSFRTPHRALALQCVWAMILSLSGSYELLISWCTFTAWVFYGLCAGAVMVLRRRMPDHPRPFRMWGYPWTAIAFLITAAAFVVSTVITRPLTSAAGLAVMAAGLPLYRYWRSRPAPNSAASR